MEVLREAPRRGVLSRENTPVGVSSGLVLCAASSLLWQEQNAGRGVVRDETREGGWLPC